jgi:hypothetical protein
MGVWSRSTNQADSKMSSPTRTEGAEDGLRGRSIAFSSLSYSPFGSLPPSSSASPSVISEASPDSSRQAQLSRLMELGEQRQKALLEEQVRVLRDKVEAKDGELQDARDLLARAQEDRSRTKLCTL